MHKSKDKPTIALTIALGAFMLTEDQGAWKAAYDADIDVQTLREWRSVLASCGDASELQTLFNGAITVPTIATLASIEATIKAVKRYPLVVGAAVGIGLALLCALFARHGRAIKDGAWQALMRLDEVQEAYRSARSRFEPACVPAPDWQHSRAVLGAREAQRRATLYLAARHQGTFVTPSAIRDDLQMRGLLYGKQTMLDALRATDGIYAMVKGKWQLGRFATDLLDDTPTPCAISA